MGVHSGNKVSLIILHDAGLTVHIVQTSGEVYVAWVPVQGECVTILLHAYHNWTSPTFSLKEPSMSY